MQHQLDVPACPALTQPTFGVFCTSAASPLPYLLPPLTPSATVLLFILSSSCSYIPSTQTAATLQSVNPAAPEELTFRDPIIDQEDPSHLLTDADMAAADAAGKAKHGVSGVGKGWWGRVDGGGCLLRSLGDLQGLLYRHY